MSKEDLKFFNSQDREELVIMCIARENKIKYLQQENKQLQQRIDKAIEYIEENSYIAQDKEINGIPLMSKRLDKCDDLLEILGDKE